MEESKQKMGTGSKVGIGCGVGCLGLVVVLGIAGFMGWKWIDAKVVEFEAEFEEKGLVHGGTSQVLNITQPPTEPTFYKGQMVTLNFSEPVTVDIGVIGQQIELVQGNFQGDVFCRGQLITVNPGVAIDGELNVTSQLLDDRGATISGGITGTYGRTPPPK